MKQSVAVFLVALVSASAFRLPDSPQGQLTHGIGKQTRDVLDALRLTQSQIRDVKLQHQKRASASLDEHLKQLEAAFDALLDKLAPLLDLTPEQVAQAEADIDTLIKDLKKMGHGEMNVDGGLEEIVMDIFNILKDFGASALPRDVSDTTTPASTFDKILEDLEQLLFAALPVLAPKLGLSFLDVIRIEKNVHSFVKHIEGMEHGTISAIDGILYCTIDLLKIAEVPSDDFFLPTTSTSTEDCSLDKVNKLFSAVITFLERQSGVPEERIQEILTGMNTLFSDMEDLCDGSISVYDGLEKLLQDQIDIFLIFDV